MSSEPQANIYWYIMCREAIYGDPEVVYVDWFYSESQGWVKSEPQSTRYKDCLACKQASIMASDMTEIWNMYFVRSDHADVIQPWPTE